MSATMNFEYHQLVFLYLQEIGDKNVLKDRHKLPEKIINEHISQYFKNLSNKKADEEFLIELQTKLEKEMARIISKKSVYYWIHLYRRIGVEKTFGESNQTILLYRNILEIAFKKYGHNNVDEDFVVYTGQPIEEYAEKIMGGLFVKALKHYKMEIEFSELPLGTCIKDFSEIDYHNIFFLECLAYYYWWITSCLRRLWKGNTLTFNLFDKRKSPFEVYATKEKEWLMKHYDKRNERYSEVATSAGVIFDNDEDDKYSIIIPQYNVERITLEESGQAVLLENTKIWTLFGELVTNFLYASYDLYGYYKMNSFVKEAFYKKYGYSFEGFVGTVYLLMISIYSEVLREVQSTVSMFQRAYSYYVSLERVISIVEEAYKNVGDDFPFEIKEGEICKILNDLLLKDDREDISLATIGPDSPLFYAGDQLIIDHKAFINVIINKTNGLEDGSESKGHDFEDIAVECLESFEYELWECKKKLKAKDGSSEEIDVSFIHKGYLFIGETKCNTMPINWIIGNKKTLEIRQSKLEKALKQIDRKAEWIYNKRKNGTNFSLPEEVHTIIPIVITPFVEYIWDDEENLWLTKDIPRICTLKECELLCNDESIDDICKKSFIKKI